MFSFFLSACIIVLYFGHCTVVCRCAFKVWTCRQPFACLMYVVGTFCLVVWFYVLNVTSPFRQHRNACPYQFRQFHPSHDCRFSDGDYAPINQLVKLVTWNWRLYDQLISQEMSHATPTCPAPFPLELLKDDDIYWLARLVIIRAQKLLSTRARLTLNQNIHPRNHLIVYPSSVKDRVVVSSRRDQVECDYVHWMCILRLFRCLSLLFFSLKVSKKESQSPESIFQSNSQLEAENKGSGA